MGRRRGISPPALLLLQLVAVAAAGLSSGEAAAEMEAVEDQFAQQRTAYHFQPFKYWQNDPNGPMYYNGYYHFFYQYNPNKAEWVPELNWGHSVSTDLVNWKELPDALLPAAPFDVGGCWSGSATILPSGPALLYTGCDTSGHQVQNVAFPKDVQDLLLREWAKLDHLNPVIPLPVDIASDKFRDPTTAWRGGDCDTWKIAVAAEVGGKGSTLVYKSKDFVTWQRIAEPMHQLAKNSGMVECPDFFPVGVSATDEGVDTMEICSATTAVKHVLKISVQDAQTDYYIVGTYDDERDAFIPTDGSTADDYRTWRQLDYGHIYAAKSFFDSLQRRRVLWAWCNESDSRDDDIAKGWAGLQIFPRKVWLDSNGKDLMQWPVHEIETLRREHVHLQDVELREGGLHEIQGLLASQLDVQVEFELPRLEGAEEGFDSNWLLDPPGLCTSSSSSSPAKGAVGPFGLFVLASGELEEKTAVFFRVFKDGNGFKLLMCSDQTRSSTRAGVYKPSYGAFVDIDLPKKNIKIPLRTLVDHSIVESFGGGGRTCMTARVYPEHLSRSPTHLFAFNYGSVPVKISSLDAWELATARINRQDDNGFSFGSNADEVY